LSFDSLGKGTARLTVRVAGQRALRRAIRTSVHSRPDRRIFEGTDAFINYCINGNHKLYSYHLRLYCIKPGSYREGVLFR